MTKLKTFFEYSLNLKDKSLSEAEAGLEAATREKEEERLQREKVETEALRSRAEFDEERDRLREECRLKCDEERQTAEKTLATSRKSQQAEMDAARKEWEGTVTKLKGEVATLNAQTLASAAAAKEELAEKTRVTRAETKAEMEAEFEAESRRRKEKWEEEIEADIQLMKKTLKEETKREVAAAEERKDGEIEALKKELERKEASIAEIDAAHKEKTQKCLDVQVTGLSLLDVWSVKSSASLRFLVGRFGFV